MTAAIAGLCAACSVLVFPNHGARRRLEEVVWGAPRSPRWRLRAAGSWHTLVSASAVGIVAAVALRSTVLAVLVPLAVWLVRRAWTARTSRFAAEQRRSEVIELCVAVCSELRAGREARAALRDAAEAACPDLAVFLAGPLAAGQDIVHVLRSAARTPGREALTLLAACWQVSEGGGGMAAAIGALADSLRARRSQRREVEAELAGVRASVKLLCALPTLGLVLGSGMGAAPVDVLLHTVAGQICLVSGIGFALGGVAWMNLIVRSAEAAS